MSVKNVEIGIVLRKRIIRGVEINQKKEFIEKEAISRIKEKKQGK